VNWFGYWWCVEDCKGTFALGFRITKSVGVKSKNIRFGGKSIQHNNLLVQVNIIRWTFSRRYWLKEFNAKDGGSNLRDSTNPVVEWGAE
jgi:hypothetical protein